jgi:tRNA acetyltransferase TAN1
LLFYKSINFNIFYLHNFSNGGELIKPTETFNLLVTLQGHKDENVGEELMGTEEIELILQNYEDVLNIKESNFPNVILIDLIMDPLEAVKIIANTPTSVISKVVPIESVVRTNLDSIAEKVVNLASDKVSSGDSFKLICDLRGRKYIKSKTELLDKISRELTEKFNLSDDGIDSDWVVQLEVVGENTGISILSPDKILKKI